MNEPQSGFSIGKYQQLTSSESLSTPYSLVAHNLELSQAVSDVRSHSAPTRRYACARIRVAAGSRNAT